MHVAMNKKSDPVQNFFIRDGLMNVKRTAPQLDFFKLLELSETIPAMKLILEMQVNIDNSNSHRYNVTS